jgi:hypothetical protein
MLCPRVVGVDLVKGKRSLFGQWVLMKAVTTQVGKNVTRLQLVHGNFLPLMQQYFLYCGRSYSQVQFVNVQN